MKSWSATTNIKTIEQHYPMLLVIQYEVVQTLSLTMKSLSATIESYWAILMSGGSHFRVCGWNCKSDHSNESYWAVLSCSSRSAICYAVYDLTCFSILSPWMKSLSVTIQMKPTGHCSKGRYKQLRATFSKNQAKFQFSGSSWKINFFRILYIIRY